MAVELLRVFNNVKMPGLAVLVPLDRVRSDDPDGLRDDDHTNNDADCVPNGFQLGLRHRLGLRGQNFNDFGFHFVSPCEVGFHYSP